MLFPALLYDIFIYRSSSSTLCVCYVWCNLGSFIWDNGGGLSKNSRSMQGFETLIPGSSSTSRRDHMFSKGEELQNLVPE